MSLTVSPTLVEQANAGEMSNADFVRCIENSLPYAWSVIASTADRMRTDEQRVAINDDVPPTEEAWGQLFRLVASDAMRKAIETHYGVRIAFQNCCKVGLFSPDAADEFEEFTSARAQILNQKPELLNC